MYPISTALRTRFENGERKCARITLNNATVKDLIITEADIVSDSLSIDRYCATGDKIEIGSAVSAELSLVLNNNDGKFDNIRFEGSELKVEIGISGVENSYIPCGYFTVDEPPRAFSKISLKALDFMMRFDNNADLTKIPFPCPVENVVKIISALCGVTVSESINFSSLPNSTVKMYKPVTTNITYRQILQWAAQVTGTCAYIDWKGELMLSWFKTTGVNITPALRYSGDILENDIGITGVVIKTERGNFVSGTEDYTLDIDGNELIDRDTEQSIADAIFSKVEGFEYRPYECSCIPMPYLYPLDTITYTDKNGNAISTVITNHTFGLNGVSAFAARGETQQKKGYASQTSVSKKDVDKAIAEAIKNSDSTAEHLHVMYSAYDGGRDSDGEISWSESPEDDTAYLGTCATNSKTKPEIPESYDWVRIKGNDGEGNRAIYMEKFTYTVKLSPEGEVVERVIITNNECGLKKGDEYIPAKIGIFGIPSEFTVRGGPFTSNGAEYIYEGYDQYGRISPCIFFDIHIPQGYKPEYDVIDIQIVANSDINESIYAWDMQTVFQLIFLRDGEKGDPGPQGADAVSYSMSANVYAIVKNSLGKYTPDSVTFSGRTQSGDSVLPYAGRFKIDYTLDNESWVLDDYESTGNENEVIYHIPDGIKAIRCSFYKAGGFDVLLDEQVIPVVSDGLDGDGYTVVLSNDSHAFAATSDGAAVESETTCKVIAYKGGGRVSATIGEITDIPDGMYVSVNADKNGTPDAEFTVSVDSDMTTESGTITIPVIVDGKNFEKQMAYTLALAGKDGDPGVGVSSVINYYLASSSPSGVTTSTSGWSDKVSTQTLSSTKKYLWNYEKVIYTDGKEKPTDPCIIGVYGSDGRGISSITEYYLTSNLASGITVENYTWYPNMQLTDSTNKYLWNYEEITYTDGKKEATIPIIIGVHGAKGDTGTSQYVHVRFSAYSNGNNFTDKPNSTTEYMGVCTTTSSDAPTTYTSYKWTKIKGDPGVGTPGAPGDSSYTHIKYSNNGTSFTDNDGEELGSWIGILVDTNEADSLDFSKYTWKKFTDDVDSTLADFDDRLNNIVAEIIKMNDRLASLVTDENGYSLMEQSGDGWVFNIGGVTKEVNNAVSDIKDLSDSFSGVVSSVEGLSEAVDDLGKLASYVRVIEENGQPCIELGESDSDFKVKITNTDIKFMEGSTVVAYISNQALNIEKAVIKEELQVGGFALKKRSNGNVGFMWKGES